MEEVVRYLASPELEGRKMHSKGDTLAIQFLVNQFENMEIKPFFNDYEQPLCTRFTLMGKKNEICSKNVIAFVEGSDKNMKEQYILVCAHFDHLGTTQGAYFPGANDNASGTATVLYLANHFAQNPIKKSIIFACFAGEESGMLGSNHFITASPELLQKINYVVNFDMVGRYDQGGLCLIGEESSNVLKQTVKKLSKRERVGIKGSASLFLQGSDHYVFYKKNIPFLCFNTGTDRGNYHRPKDHADSIDYKGMKIVADFAKQVIEELGSNSKKPKFKKIGQKKAEIDNSEILDIIFANPNKFGFVYNFGIDCGNEITIFKTTPKGAEAGLLAGDKVIKINGKTFSCMMDFFDIAKTEKEKPYRISILRNGEEMEILVY